MPGTTVPGVMRVPDIRLNRAQRQVVQQQARRSAAHARARGVDPVEAARSGDRATREFYARAREAAAEDLKHVNARVGLQTVRRNPEAFGTTSGQVQYLTRLASHGRLPGDVRDTLAQIGGVVSSARRVRARAGEPRGVGSAITAGIDLKPVLAAQRAIGAGRGALRAAREAANAGTGAFESNGLLTNAAKDTLNLPAEAVSSAYFLGSKAAQGDVTGVASALAQPYLDAFSSPKAFVRAFEAHPVNTVLLALGPKAATGRGAGALMRHIPSTRRAASTSRAPITVPGTNIVELRSYSPDVITKARQVAAERLRERSAGRLERKAAAVGGDRALELRSKAAQRRYGSRRSMAGIVQRRVDERVDANETLRRAARADTVKAATRVVGRVARRDRPVLSLVAQGVIAPTTRDLRAYRRELAGVDRSKLSRSQLAQHRDTVKRIDRALEHGVDWRRIGEAADAYRAVRQPLEGELTGARIVDPAQAERRRLLPYAVRNMGAERRMVDGREVFGIKARVAGQERFVPLTNDMIRAHMRMHGVREPVFVTQAPGRRGARNFYRNQQQAANAGSVAFTGEATRKGTFDIHPETLVEAAANAQSLVSQQKGFTALIRELGAREGTFKSRTDAEAAARNLMLDKNGDPIPGALRMVPVRLNPFSGSRAQLEHLLREADLDAGGRQKINDALDSALQGADGPGPWGLIPEVAAKRMREHLQVGSSSAGQIAQVVNQTFRRTVLATSPSWLFGNVAESGLRAAVAGAGPMSWITAHRTIGALRLMDPEAALELEARAMGGAHISMAERQKIRRAAEDFENTRVEPVARALGAFWRAPGPRQAARLWGAWTNLMFSQVNRRMERQFQKAMLGKAIRQSSVMEGRLRKNGEQAIMDAARGLRNTPSQVALARQVDRMYGRYSKFSPGERRLLANYTPFLAWSLSAVNFIYRVLPKDHPVLVSLLASANQASEEWRKEQGLDLFADSPLPGFLQGSIPLPDGRHLRVSRYTPFGAFGSPADTIESLVLPQTQGVLAALRGEDWKGKKLRVEGRELNDLDKARFAAQAFLESTVPGLSRGKTIAKKGLVHGLNPLEPVGDGGSGGSAIPAGMSEGDLRRAFSRARRAASSGPSDAELERAFARARRAAR